MTQKMAHKQQIPAIGFGTFGRNGAEGEAAIAHALAAGYRHIDTAQSYNTEAECGRAIASSGIARNDIFVTTKVEMPNLRQNRLLDSLEESREKLQLDQLDLTLIHWPVDPDGAIPKQRYLEDLATAQDKGLTRMIGVSNYTVADVSEAQSILGDRVIANNQFELHPYLQNRKLANFCHDNDIAVTCYCPLGQGVVVNDPVLVEIGAKHGADGSQIALAFLIAKGYAVIPTSGKQARIKSNFAAGKITLDSEDITRIEALDRNHRVINPGWSPAWD